jgi:ATP-binding cassette, subfamily B, bacterial
MQKEKNIKQLQAQPYNGEIPRTPFRFLLYIHKEFKWIGLFSFCVVCIASVLGQGVNYIFKIIVDASDVGDIGKVFFFALLYPCGHFIVQILFRITGFSVALWTTSFKKKVNDVLIAYLLRHSHQYFSSRFSGSLMSKIGSVVGGVESFIPDLMWTHIPAVISFLIASFFIWRADTFSGLFFVCLIITLLVTNRLMAQTKRELSYMTAESGTQMRGVIADVLSNISTTRQYVRIHDEIRRIQEKTHDWKEKSKANWFATEKMLLLNTVILFVFSIIIFYFLAERLRAGDISTGDFVFIFALYGNILHTLLFIGRAFNNTARVFGEMEEGLLEILQPIEIEDASDAQELKVSRGKIEWKNVSFNYGNNTVFNSFNLTIQSGQRVGLVGQSGSGKTTFVSLLLRQHDLNNGSICIDEQDISNVTQDSLRECIAVVPQEPMLFHRSIRDNIAYGNPNATEDEIIDVAKKAEAHDFIMALSDGYDTRVGERGIKLSGGQKQRIAIARAMLKKAPILILDEATSALDSESEASIQKALHELMEGKTVIAIAHRLSTLREMDRIIVLDKGKIIEDGTHIKLVHTKGMYARLWKHQAGGFLQE